MFLVYIVHTLFVLKIRTIRTPEQIRTRLESTALIVVVWMKQYVVVMVKTQDGAVRMIVIIEMKKDGEPEAIAVDGVIIKMKVLRVSRRNQIQM